MSYLTGSSIVFTLKMESQTQKYHFQPKNDDKSGLEFFFEIDSCGKLFFLTS